MTWRADRGHIAGIGQLEILPRAGRAEQRAVWRVGREPFEGLNPVAERDIVVVEQRDVPALGVGNAVVQRRRTAGPAAGDDIGSRLKVRRKLAHDVANNAVDRLAFAVHDENQFEILRRLAGKAH